jgi:hypothetical protein
MILQRFQLAVRNIDTTRVVATGFRTLNLSSNEIQSLITSPLFKRTVPEVVGPQPKKAVATKVPEINVEDVLKRAKEVVQSSIDIAAVIESRAKHIRMQVSYERQPDLWRACSSLFKNFVGTVSFTMYKNLLIYYNQLMLPLQDIN